MSFLLAEMALCNCSNRLTSVMIDWLLAHHFSSLHGSRWNGSELIAIEDSSHQTSLTLTG